MIENASSETARIDSRRPTAIDLFCGAGGMSLGLTQAGFSILYAVDAWEIAVESYKKNFKHPVICADLSRSTHEDLKRLASISNASVDLVVGGPPCQGFSVQRVGPDDDKRNNLVLEFARLVTEIAPRFFIMENVPGLVGKRGRDLLDSFLEKVHAAGYDAEGQIVNAADFGVPQIRRRIIVLGWLRTNDSSLSFPPKTHEPRTYQTVWNAICNLPIPVGPKDLNPPDLLHRETRLSELNRKRLEHIPPGGGMQDLPHELRVNCHKIGAETIGHRYVYGRLAPDRPAATITARFDSFTRGRFAHPKQNRNITLREGARLQSFPDDFNFVGNQEEIAAQIGNAVPPKLARSLGVAVCEAIYLRSGQKPGAPTHSKPIVAPSRKQLSLFPGNESKALAKRAR